MIHGFVLEPDGTIVTFDPPGNISTEAISIDANGTMVGSYQLADMSVHGFIRQADGTIVSFDPPVSTGTMVTAFNNAGAITAYYTAASGRTFGFVRDSDGIFMSFDAGTITVPTSINYAGTITGSYLGNNGSHDFIRSPEGIITSFVLPGEPPGVTSCLGVPIPTSINPEGVITGWCVTRNPGLLSRIGWVRYP